MPFLPERPLSFAAVDHRREKGRVFGILPEDLMRHAWVLGKTGMGKSVLLEHLLTNLIERGSGCALIDPHGELAERVLDLVPSWRLNDVVLLDAADTSAAIGWNPLDRRAGGERALICSNVLAALRKVFFDAWGARTEHILRNTLLALLEVPGTTLLGAVRMLSEEGYREHVVERVRDPLVRYFWTREFPQYPAAFLAEVVAPVQNKIAAVLTNPFLRAIVGQRRSTVTAAQVMDGRRIFIASIPKGRIGEEGSAMLGAVLTSSFQAAAYARAAMAPEERVPFVLAIDEFASFVSRSFAELLAESRKYRLGLILAHQYLAQLDEGLRAALLGNVGTTIAFRPGAEDAQVLAEEFSPEVDAGDLVGLGAPQIALRLAVGGISTRAFTATTLPPRNTVPGHAATIRRISRERYATPRARIDAEVIEQLGAGCRPPTAQARRRSRDAEDAARSGYSADASGQKRLL
jgi:hypothetical protein